MHPYLDIGRPLTSVMIGLAVLTSALIGAGGDADEYTLPIFLGFTIAFLFGIAGNAINDYLDRENDKINHPDRPIPSGKLKPGQALNFAIIFFIISLVLSLLLSLMVGYAALMVVIAALVFQIAYELRFKHEKIIGNMIIGSQTALAFVFGGVVVGQSLITGIIAIAVFLSISGREIVKDIEDVKGDIDRKTLPIMIGVKRAGIVAALLILLAVLISPIPYYPLYQFGWEYLSVVLIADLLFIGSIPVIFKNAKLARKMLKFAMLIAILAFITGAIFRA
ncbi:4-hydroxybenzoate polyprenyltransferase-like prenyltransferase [Candidatus Methanoperedens nitroreducens]|uniref:Digeranylgeranylglyceryl phosphate synthase n=1 Tax=Candidatus Methanoperedens nitratireducens TaxID=1392998 RepID=A0A062VE52_9EURY|nr:UbiA family prenyltransferase [Candidatus Methanoperedens nitroreducens]KCZ73445.1 4-hydroxybenzoate polyprenyltransferase-like prenyltransferase [Candidatus Methanoperedens nitroreducens]MDJ1422599.1 UbiA family prenyltransferase [Candidatus Methanoperedens sp.]